MMAALSRSRCATVHAIGSHTDIHSRGAGVESGPFDADLIGLAWSAVSHAQIRSPAPARYRSQRAIGRATVVVTN